MSTADETTPGTVYDVDILIVGAGPTGLYGTYYAGFRDLRVALIDALPQTGGQVAALYPEKAIHDVAGLPAVRGQELVDSLHEQALSADPLLLLGRTAVGLEEHEDGVEVTTDTGELVRAKAVLITGGIGSFTPRELPVGSEYLGRGLRYFVPRLAELADQDVLVVGGGDSALDWALGLEPIARSVTLVHRRPQFRAHERSVTQLHESGIEVLTPFEVAKVSGDPGIDEVVVETRDGDRRTLAVQAVVAALGFIADLGPIEGWGLELHRRHILVDRTMRTNRTRVFAAGDLAHYDGKVKLISIGFGEAALAVNHIAALVRPGTALNPGHSSDQ
ncbi:FAD-dependent oxidoreductase [Nocardioides sp. LMS-CY]|uniref:Ferredoxin--NADP reductase n=1 Tax=Nocardioides soli TaxID=1036020 RepID=A0A7W4VWR8_9ACTN|nr:MULTISPECIES: NAD(P)/FAD-dependent oxidoreductase [Nocardioides]MBB3043208.1 thioredoxin reductase (NADPH) [Nocardioides soli]QWF23238.1 FAD-dependent oxidoreductase [Nocardioides sp. LMS-CY]